MHNPYLLKRFGFSQHTNQVHKSNEPDLLTKSNVNDDKGSTINGAQNSTKFSGVGANSFVNNYVSNNGDDEEYDASVNFSRFPNSSYMKMSVFKPSGSAKNTNQSITCENSTKSLSNKLVNSVTSYRKNDFQEDYERSKYRNNNDNNNGINSYNWNHSFVGQKFEKVWEEKCGKKFEDEISKDNSGLHTPPQKVFPLNGVMSCLSSESSAHSNDDSPYTNYNVASANSKNADRAASTLSSLPPLHPLEQSYLNYNIQHHTSVNKFTSNSKRELSDDKVSKPMYELSTLPENNFENSGSGVCSNVARNKDKNNNEQTHQINVNDNSIDALQMWKEEQEEANTGTFDENFINDNSNTDISHLDNEGVFVSAAMPTDQLSKVKCTSEDNEVNCKELAFRGEHLHNQMQNEYTLENGKIESKENFDAFMNTLLGESRTVLSDAKELLKQTVDHAGNVKNEVKIIQDEHNLHDFKNDKRSSGDKHFVISEYCQNESSNVSSSGRNNVDDDVTDAHHFTEEMDRNRPAHKYVLKPPAALPTTQNQCLQTTETTTTTKATTSPVFSKTLSSSSSEKPPLSFKEQTTCEVSEQSSISLENSDDEIHEKKNMEVDCLSNPIVNDFSSRNDVNETEDIYFVSPASNDMEYNPFPIKTENDSMQKIEPNELWGNTHNKHRAQTVEFHKTQRLCDNYEFDTLHSPKLVSKLTVELTCNPERVMQCRVRRRGYPVERREGKDWNQENPLESEEQEEEVNKVESNNNEVTRQKYAGTSPGILPENIKRSFPESVTEHSENQKNCNYCSKENSDRINISKNKLKISKCNNSMLNCKMSTENKANESTDNDKSCAVEQKHTCYDAKKYSVTSEDNIDSLMHKLLLFLRSDSKCEQMKEEERSTGEEQTVNSISEGDEQLFTRNKIRNAETLRIMAEQESILKNNVQSERKMQLFANKNRYERCEEEEKKIIANKLSSDANADSEPLEIHSLSFNKITVERSLGDNKNKNKNNNKKKKEETKNKGKDKVLHDYTAPTKSFSSKIVVRKS